VQQARRDAGLAVSDRIRLTIGADGAVADAVRAHAGFVAAETLAVDLDVRPSAELGADPHPLADAAVKLALTRVPLLPLDHYQLVTRAAGPEPRRPADRRSG
jgi:hypothetical protein